MGSLLNRFKEIIVTQFLRLGENAVILKKNSDGTSTEISLSELAVLDGLLATAAEINRSSDLSTRVVVLTATTAITLASHEGKTCLMSEAGGNALATFTLPAATGTGGRYRFVVGEVNTSNYVIKVADATDIMYGNVITNSAGDTPDLAQPWPTAADSDTITLNGTTTGGAAIGDFIELEDVATNVWAVYGVTTSSGTEATPFSATVS